MRLHEPVVMGWWQTLHLQFMTEHFAPPVTTTHAGYVRLTHGNNRQDACVVLMQKALLVASTSQQSGIAVPFVVVIKRVISPAGIDVPPLRLGNVLKLHQAPARDVIALHATNAHQLRQFEQPRQAHGRQTWQRHELEAAQLLWTNMKHLERQMLSRTLPQAPHRTKYIAMKHYRYVVLRSRQSPTWKRPATKKCTEALVRLFCRLLLPSISKQRKPCWLCFADTNSSMPSSSGSSAWLPAEDGCDMYVQHIESVNSQQLAGGTKWCEVANT